MLKFSDMWLRAYLIETVEERPTYYLLRLRQSRLVHKIWKNRVADVRILRGYLKSQNLEVVSVSVATDPARNRQFHRA